MRHQFKFSVISVVSNLIHYVNVWAYVNLVTPEKNKKFGHSRPKCYLAGKRSGSNITLLIDTMCSDDFLHTRTSWSFNLNILQQRLLHRWSSPSRFIRRQFFANESFVAQYLRPPCGIPYVWTISRWQEPITRSFYLPYWPSESTLSRIVLFLEAPPTVDFAGVFKIASYKRAVILYCYIPHMQAARTYFNNGWRQRVFTEN